MSSTDDKSQKNKTMFKISFLIFYFREDIKEKKTFSFGHCPNHLTPPPPDPNSGNWVLFSDVKIQDLKVTWGEGREIYQNLKNS